MDHPDFIVCSFMKNFIGLKRLNNVSTAENYTNYYIISGKFMYIESSAPRRPGQKAWLVSKQIGFSTPMCLNFYYHMYGTQIGSLNVYVKTGVALPSTPVWTKSQNQGQMWNLAQATIQATTQPYRVSLLNQK